MRLLSKIKHIKQAREHKRHSDAASRQMQLDAQESVEARLSLLEVRLRNELREP